MPDLAACMHACMHAFTLSGQDEIYLNLRKGKKRKTATNYDDIVASMTLCRQPNMNSKESCTRIVVFLAFNDGGGRPAG